MCVVSNLGDSWKQTAPQRFPWTQPYVQPNPNLVPGEPVLPWATPQQIEELRQEMQELKKLLLAAKQYDEATGQPDCHMDEKVELIRQLAELVGVDVDDVFGPYKD